MQIAKKISVGSINGVRAGFRGVTETTLVGRILGQAMSVVSKDSDKGTYQTFKGEFRAINADGEETAAPVCFLPSPAQEMLASAVDAAQGKPVAFAFDIFVVPNATAVLGYEYKIKPLLETAPSDPLKALMASVPALEIKHKQAPLLGNDPAMQSAAEPAVADAQAEQGATEMPKSNGKKK